MPTETSPGTTGAKRSDDPGGGRPRPPRPDGVRADQTAEAAADQHGGTDTWKQAENAAGTQPATWDVPEPDSLGG